MLLSHHVAYNRYTVMNSVHHFVVSNFSKPSIIYPLLRPLFMGFFCRYSALPYSMIEQGLYKGVFAFWLGYLANRLTACAVPLATPFELPRNIVIFIYFYSRHFPGAVKLYKKTINVLKNHSHLLSFKKIQVRYDKPLLSWAVVFICSGQRDLASPHSQCGITEL